MYQVSLMRLLRNTKHKENKNINISINIENQTINTMVTPC